MSKPIFPDGIKSIEVRAEEGFFPDTFDVTVRVLGKDGKQIIGQKVLATTEHVEMKGFAFVFNELMEMARRKILKFSGYDK